MNEPRLRMFAGPNGSGKSTLKDILKAEWLGVYINPDDMEKAIRQRGYLDFTQYELVVDERVLRGFLKNSSLLKKYHLLDDVDQLTFSENKLYFNLLIVNSYHASVLSDFIRQELIAAKISFSFETVMSSEDKVLFLQTAQQAGFRTYLYYVATEAVEINIERVQIRVSQGGHAVPEEKIRTRYDRSLELLIRAVDFSNRAFIFDNSGEDKAFIAEVTDGQKIEMQVDEMPHWFKTALWDKFAD
jgi:predicted ABC-type ATPase